MWQKSSEGKLVIVEIIREGLVLLTLTRKLQQMHFIFVIVVSELDCVTTFYLRIDQMIAINKFFFYSKLENSLSIKLRKFSDYIEKKKGYIIARS